MASDTVVSPHRMGFKAINAFVANRTMVAARRLDYFALKTQMLRRNLFYHFAPLKLLLHVAGFLVRHVNPRKKQFAAAHCCRQKEVPYIEDWLNNEHTIEKHECEKQDEDQLGSVVTLYRHKWQFAQRTARIPRIG